MELKDYIEEVINYIEDNIHETLTADSISEKIGYSKYYLHRIFQIYTGLTLMDYVRKRKLHYASIDLHSDKRILDIAIDYGYGSERSFSRAFVKEFGKSPSYFRDKPVCSTEKLMVYDLRLPGKVWLEHMKDYLSKIKYETLSEMRVISGKRMGSEPEDEIIGVMTKFKETHHINVQRSFGFDVPVDESDQAKGYRAYEFWLVTEDDVTDLIHDTEFVVKTIPSYKYVSLRIADPFENPFEKIPNGWKTLVAWLEENKVLCNMDNDKNLDCLEEVGEEDGVMYMDIFIPITKG